MVSSSESCLGSASVLASCMWSHTCCGSAALATLVNRALMSSSWNESPLVGMLLLHEERLLWSNLSLQDTSSLQHLISCMLQPAIWTAYSGFLKAPLTGNAR